MVDIEIIHSDSNNVNEDALYDVFVDIILSIQAHEKDDKEKD